jgi:hypothetical protein
MLGGVGNIGTLSARRRVIAAAGGGGGDGRSGSADSDHVHTISGLNTLYMIPDIHYEATGTDNTDNYSIKDISFTSGSSVSHTFYLACKLKNNTSAFHNDVAVGAIQIFRGDTCVFAGGAEDASIFTTSDDVGDVDPTGSITFSAVNTVVANGRWNVGSSTGSSGTGAADSISTDFQSTSNPLPNAGEAIVPQASSTNFLFVEATSSGLNDKVYLKFTVSLTKNTAHKFVFAYNFGVINTDTGDDKDDNMGLFIEN